MFPVVLSPRQHFKNLVVGTAFTLTYYTDTSSLGFIPFPCFSGGSSPETLAKPFHVGRTCAWLGIQGRGEDGGARLPVTRRLYRSS